MKKTKVIEILKRAAPPHSPFGEHIDDWEKRYEILLDECADAIMETECQHEWKVKKDSGYCSKCGITTEPEGEGAIDDAIKSIESKRKSTKYKMVPQPPPSEAAIEPTKSAEEFLNDKLGTKDYTHSPLSIYRKELAEWLNEYDQSQLPSEEEILNILTIYERLNSREVGEAIDPSLPGNQAVLSMKAKAIVKRFKD